MSFKCQGCGEPQRDGNKTVGGRYRFVPARPRRVVVETRDRVYEPRVERHDSGDVLVDRGGRGTEIVRELDLCPGCALAATGPGQNEQR